MSGDEVPSDATPLDVREATKARGVMTFSEIVEGELLPVSLELLGPARSMADELDTEITTILIGEEPELHTDVLIAHGADKVVIVKDDRLSQYTTLPFTRAISDWVTNVQRPEILLMGATTTGRDLAPRLASRVKAGVTADCTKLSVGEFYHRATKTLLHPVLEAWRPSFGEQKLACIVANPKLTWCPQMATARPGVFEPPKRDENRAGEVIEFTPDWVVEDFVVEVVEVERGGDSRVQLNRAKVIVAGGEPCGEDRFASIIELTEALSERGVDAEWAATRVAVDHGHAPHARQIGQTGQVVRPDTYIAVGISGAPQHMEGMKESKRLIAINIDSDCTMVQSSDTAIIGEYSEVLPELIKAVKEEGFTFGH